MYCSKSLLFVPQKNRKLVWNFYFSFLCKWPFKLDFLHAVKQQGPKGLQNVIKPTSHWISPSIHTAVLFLWPVGKFNTVSLLWSILIYSLKCITLELVLLVDMSMRHGNEPRPQLRQGDRTRQETAHISPCKWCFHATFIWIQALSHKITPCLLFSWAGTNLLCLHSILLLNSCTARAGPAGSNTPHLRAHGCEWWERVQQVTKQSEQLAWEMLWWWSTWEETHEFCFSMFWFPSLVISNAPITPADMHRTNQKFGDT